MEYEGKHFLVMEMLSGEMLKHPLMAGAIPLDQLLDLAVQITDALDPAVLAFDYAEAGESHKAFAWLDKGHVQKSDALVAMVAITVR